MLTGGILFVALDVLFAGIVVYALRRNQKVTKDRESKNS